MTTKGFNEGGFPYSWGSREAKSNSAAWLRLEDVQLVEELVGQCSMSGKLGLD